MKHGILLIDKPSSMTSHDVVQIARRALHERSIGHLGTLDPAATGLLVLFVGKKALKVLELFKDADKEYIATVELGKTSSTCDREGVIEDVPIKKGWIEPQDADVDRVLKERFMGTIHQRPPAHSAIHINGKRAYELVRENQLSEVNMPEREVTVNALQLLTYSYPIVKLRIECSTGTYIRSIARDLGEVLHCGAYLSDLRRTRVAEWKVDDAVRLASGDDHDISWGRILPLKEIMTVFTRKDLTDDQWEDIRNGRCIRGALGSPQPVIAWHEDLPVAILKKKEKGVGPRKVL